MDIPSDANGETTTQLARLETAYWREVDQNSGRHAQDSYILDGSYTIGDKVMRGQEEISSFYKWRESRGRRTARHIITNFFLIAADGDTAHFECILSLHAADGTPVLASKPPIMIADVSAECVRGANRIWKFKTHILRPIFMGGEAPTIP